jgi:integrase
MRWQDLDLSSGFWRIPETKSGTPVIVPLVEPALAILRARRESANGSEWVFPGRRGGHLTEPKGAWKRICKAAKLDDLRPHDLRRSLGSWMAGQNISLPIIGRMLGHKTAQTTMVYSRLALDPLREAVDRATAAMLTAGGQTKLLTNSTPHIEGHSDKGTD